MTGIEPNRPEVIYLVTLLVLELGFFPRVLQPSFRLSELSLKLIVTQFGHGIDLLGCGK